LKKALGVKRPLKFEKGRKKERKKERKKKENEGLPRLGGNKYVN
jgi:hypothetical protein